MCFSSVAVPHPRQPEQSPARSKSATINSFFSPSFLWFCFLGPKLLFRQLNRSSCSLHSRRTAETASTNALSYRPQYATIIAFPWIRRKTPKRPHRARRFFLYIIALPRFLFACRDGCRLHSGWTEQTLSRSAILCISFCCMGSVY